MLHAWLDSWSGLGSIVVGMQRHGYDLTLTHDRNGWRATFLHRSHVLHPWVGQVLHDGPHVWLVSRTGRDHAGRFPEMAEAVRRLSAPTLILDGEVAPFDEQFVSRFHLLHEETGKLATPPVLVAFDCLWRRGPRPPRPALGERRPWLEREIGDEARLGAVSDRRGPWKGVNVPPTSGVLPASSSREGSHEATRRLAGFRRGRGSRGND